MKNPERASADTAERPDGDSGETGSRLDALRAKARRLPARLAEERGRHASVDTSFLLVERERRIAASVLAGGLAYRLFFWTLPLALIFGGVLGFTSSQTAEDVAEDAGLTRAAADAVGETAVDANRARWVLLLIGIGGLIWASSWAVVALRRVYSLVWNVPLVRSRNPLKEAVAFSGICLLMLGIPAAADWLRERYEGPGLAVTLLSIGAFFGIWLWISLWLPHADAPLRALVPGALLFALAAQAMHLFTALYLADRLERSSALYGALGTAATTLFFLYIIGRLVVSTAVLNAELWSRQKTQEEPGPNSPG